MPRRWAGSMSRTATASRSPRQGGRSSQVLQTAAIRFGGEKSFLLSEEPSENASMIGIDLQPKRALEQPDILLTKKALDTAVGWHPALIVSALCELHFS